LKQLCFLKQITQISNQEFQEFTSSIFENGILMCIENLIREQLIVRLKRMNSDPIEYARSDFEISRTGIHSQN
jgi:hypothetical protein